MNKLFGTDGIRGIAGIDVTADLACDVGRALVSALRAGELGPRVERPTVVVGRDTRPSGPSLEGALVEGMTSLGADVLTGGILPTPGVAFLTADEGADAGVVISASHNPAQDNGVKIFGAGGWKLAPDVERAIEVRVGEANGGVEGGASAEIPEALERYVDHLTDSRTSLAGLRVVVDCANGAAFRAAPEALRRLGADVTAINATDDGERINDGCGALHPDIVAAHASDAIGITLDGDADRVLLVDEIGRLVDGDAILAILASHLGVSGVVITVMANQALRGWCERAGIEVVETSVGDRHVLEAMRSGGYPLGGEQSGHVIMLDRSTTGDGILTAIAVLEAVAERGGRLCDIVPFEPFPQVLVNVTANGRAPDEHGVRLAITEAERRLGSDGRVLVRPSGTEPIVRVMVEARDADLAGELAEFVADAVRRVS